MLPFFSILFASLLHSSNIFIFYFIPSIIIAFHSFQLPLFGLMIVTLSLLLLVFFFSPSPSMSQAICQYICIYFSLYLSSNLSTYLSICLSGYLYFFICLFIYINLPIFSMSVYIFFSICICLFIYFFQSPTFLSYIRHFLFAVLPTSVLVVNPGPAREGDQVRLMCTSTGSRPSATLTWTVRGVTRPAQKEVS